MSAKEKEKQGILRPAVSELGSVVLNRLLTESSHFLVYEGDDPVHHLKSIIMILRRDIPDYELCLGIARREAEILKGCSHLNLCPVFLAEEADGWFYVTRPKIDGYSLGDYRPREHGLLNIGRVVELMQAASLGMAVAHHKSIVHHNICDMSIHIDGRNVVRVKDFYPARVIYALDQRKQEADGKVRVSVSPLYISPEKAETGTEDRRGDVFSFGVLFYYLLTGRYPFQGSSPLETIYARIRRKDVKKENIYNEVDQLPDYLPPPPPHELRSGIHPKISELVLRMLSYYPAHRPDFSEVLVDFNTKRARDEIMRMREIQNEMVTTDTRELPQLERLGGKSVSSLRFPGRENSRSSLISNIVPPPPPDDSKEE